MNTCSPRAIQKYHGGFSSTEYSRSRGPRLFRSSCKRRPHENLSSDTSDWSSMLLITYLIGGVFAKIQRPLKNVTRVQVQLMRAPSPTACRKVTLPTKTQLDSQHTANRRCEYKMNISA